MIDLQTVVKVGIADMNIVKGHGSIRTSGLGSCVGVVLYDEYVKLAGMVHVMLPSSGIAKEGSVNPAKYADSGIDELICQLMGLGARLNRLKCKMAGGAQMFQLSSKSELMRIGPRNVEAVKERLLSNHIPIIGEDVGGNKGRTIEFFVSDCTLQVRTVNEGTKTI
ncbi:chemotaxis protein CheD [Rossellomorea aquimaris]|uniref:chemotaxis protein CheD n=1 Tax=Rossellomorea aquimaris TaxID=189382 RepID=UPI001CD29CE7|nr:chemotaxis protein CheD [Rossellomorea aquimaris]MCA1053535.1 chemotaxis protein CheD [Rossellomorea aquimaris]